MKRKQKLILKLFIIPLVFITLPLRFIVQAQNEDASPAAEEVQRKVQEKILKASQKPKAYIGTVTDISENTIQISKFSLDNSQKRQRRFSKSVLLQVPLLLMPKPQPKKLNLKTWLLVILLSRWVYQKQ